MDNILTPYFELISESGIYPKPKNLLFYLNFMFEGIEFEEKTMLDIGGGTGLYTLYAGVRGVKSGICLEPEDAGSTLKSTEHFYDYSEQLGLSNIKLIPSKFQDFKCPHKFDIILLHDSINHLDEQACSNLLKDYGAKAIYDQIFQGIDELAAPGAYLIIVDCSRHNFYPMISLKNPFAPGIEWEKHQSPEFWAQMLSKHHFSLLDIRWNSFNSLRRLGRKFLGNKIGAFFTLGSFCLRMKHFTIQSY